MPSEPAAAPLRFPDPMDTFRSASRRLEESDEWLALRAEEERLEYDLRNIKRQKQELIDRVLDGCYLDCLDYSDCTCGRRDEGAE